MDVNQLFNMLNQIPVTEDNKQIIDDTRTAIEEGDYQLAIDKINQLYNMGASSAEPEPEPEPENEPAEFEPELESEPSDFEPEGEAEEIQDNSEEYESEVEDPSYESPEEEEEDIEEEPEEEYNQESENEPETSTESEDLPLPNPEDFYDNDEIEEDESSTLYPEKLLNNKLEETYIGMLLNNPKAMSMYYILFDDNYLASAALLNIYKCILFTEGQAYAPEVAKRGYNFATETRDMQEYMEDLRDEYRDKNYNLEKIYTELRKLFVLRKEYLGMPIKATQDKIVEIVDYSLYDKMSIDEVSAAVEQVTVTQKFKSSILSSGVSAFLRRGDNTLTTGLSLPFTRLSEVFKGLRKGETMSFSMPSNAGKSRFTINLAAYIAFIHKKKVLVISNEMSEEKMKLCLITTIINNPEIQQLHGQKISKTEGELLEFKFRPDDPSSVEVDEKGYVLKHEKESQERFAKRLETISTEYRQTMAATKWLDEQINNSIYFINITDHTNDELKKVIVNYYYKEHIEYMFYDTMKTDTENIGNGEELKKTATILSNLAQDFKIYIGSTLQLTETSTLPINLSINDLAVSRTVKEVLDTLCLIKQIQKEDLSDYEYTLEEVSNDPIELQEYDDPDVRYYACVVDKNRAGAKPKLLFRLNLAYNIWEEIGYLRLKSKQ